MSHPDLEGARLKLDRAREHVVGLETERRRLMERQAAPFRPRLEKDVQPDRLVVVVDEIDPPESSLAIILGDALHNFRSAVDHIAWQLFEHGNRPSLKPGQLKQIQFPIFSTLEEFDAEIHKRRIPGILSVHETVVRLHQPYQRRDLADGHPLAILERLSNADKHRNINVGWWVPSDYASIEVTEVPDGCHVLSVTTGPDLEKRLEVDAKLAYIELLAGSNHAGMKVQCKGRLSIEVGEGLPLHRTIGWIEREVSDLLAEIDRVL